jgi:hypothetical protein
VLHHRQAEPRSPRAANSIRAEEPLEESGEVLLGDSRPVVRDRQSPGGDADRERAPRSRVADRVLGEVLDDDTQHSGSKRQLRRGIAFRPDGDARAVRGLPNPSEHLLDDRQGARRAERDDRTSALELAQEQDVVDELADVLDLRPRLLDERRRVLPGKGRRLQQGEQARQRRPELVRDGSREAGPQLLVGGELAGRAEVQERLTPALDLVGHPDGLVTALGAEQLVRHPPSFLDPVEAPARGAARGQDAVVRVDDEEHLPALLDERASPLGAEPKLICILAAVLAVSREEPPHHTRVWRRS